MPRAARRAVILTALRSEYLAVRTHLEGLREELGERGTVYEHGTLGAGHRVWEVVLAQIAPGNTSAAIEAERAVRQFQPTVLLFVGVAGGVKDVALGDVVAATKIYGYESGKDRSSRFRPRPEVALSSYSMVQRAMAEARAERWLARLGVQAGDARPTALTGPIAAGEKVVASRRAATARFLGEHYGDTLAVEMEGRGFLSAAEQMPEVEALVVRGISDLLSGKQINDDAGWQPRAARHAAAFAVEVLLNLHGATRPTRPRVLMVEDDTMWAEAAIRMLAEELGCDVVLAATLAAAAKQLQEMARGVEQFDAAIVDIMVPGADLTYFLQDGSSRNGPTFRNGLELCEYARRGLGLTPEHLPMLCISALPQLAITKLLDPLAVGFLAKPFAADELVGRLRTMLGAPVAG